MIINLSQEEVRVCTMLSMERWLTKFGSEDRPNYALGKQNGLLEHELLANIRANVSEWAASKAYNVSWNVPWYPNYLHPQRKELPDIGTNGEVRTIRTRHSIPFWEKDMGKIIIGTKILDDEYYSSVEVYGHFTPETFKSDVYYDDAISGWRVPIEELTKK